MRVPLHHHHVRFELSFGCAVENLIDFFLNRLRDLFLSAFLAYRAWDILDFKQVGPYCRSGQISPRSTLWTFPRHTFQYSVNLDSRRSPSIDRVLESYSVDRPVMWSKASQYRTDGK